MSMSDNEKRAAKAAARCLADLREYGSGTVIVAPQGYATTVPSVRVVGSYNGETTLDRLADDIQSSLDALESGSGGKR